MKIERSADDVCLAFLFDGEIVGLIAKGAFVRFGEEGFEGFLPVRRMRGWHELNEEETALIGPDSSGSLRIGDPIKVAVLRIEAPRGRVDLIPA